MSEPNDQLTVILPTRNRSYLAAATIELFKSAGVSHQIIIADSSDTLDHSLQQAASKGTAILRRYPPETGLYDKLTDVAKSVTTPFVLTIPDKKLTLPYGIDELLTYLQNRADYVAASGYVLRYAMLDSDIDIYRVHIFTPSIVDEDPLRRVFELMRRYQPSAFALFRTEALLACARQASAVRGLIFQEIMFMNALVLQGKAARLPLVFGLHGAEQSISPVVQRDPMMWFLADGRSFLDHYRGYCDKLAAYILSLGIQAPAGVDLKRLLDLFHASWLGHNIDIGMVNHVARGLLGDDMPPLVEKIDWPGPRPVGPQDRIDSRAARRHIWRHTVLAAEPREEITIRDRDIHAVNDALDSALVDPPGTMA